MNNLKNPRVRVKVPGKNRSVEVKVTPPETDLYVKVGQEGEALVVRIAPNGFQVEVNVSSVDETDLEGQSSFVASFSSPSSPVPSTPAPSTPDSSSSEGLIGERQTSDSSRLEVEAQDLAALRVLFEQSDDSFGDILEKNLASAPLADKSAQGPIDDGPSYGLEGGGLDSTTYEGESVYQDLAEESKLKQLEPISETRALLSQLPDLGLAPSAASAKDDSRSATAHLLTEGLEGFFQFTEVSSPQDQNSADSFELRLTNSSESNEKRGEELFLENIPLQLSLEPVGPELESESESEPKLEPELELDLGLAPKAEPELEPEKKNQDLAKFSSQDESQHEFNPNQSDNSTVLHDSELILEDSFEPDDSHEQAPEGASLELEDSEPEEELKVSQDFELSQESQLKLEPSAEGIVVDLNAQEPISSALNQLGLDLGEGPLAKEQAESELSLKKIDKANEFFANPALTNLPEDDINGPQLEELDDLDYDPVKDPAAKALKYQESVNYGDELDKVYGPIESADDLEGLAQPIPAPEPTSEGPGAALRAKPQAKAEAPAMTPAVDNEGKEENALKELILVSSKEESLLEPVLAPSEASATNQTLGARPLIYSPPRSAAKTVTNAEASTAVIVNYLDDVGDSFVSAQGPAEQLTEEEDLDIDLLDMRSQEPIRLAARPMVPVPKVPM
ncbi:MAG: hypothetical protein LBV23_06550 [Deltaproteobacteria bacterium]|jgi:hypothetical protein|nr:hypothetical protein [Deltaproteobacteria bacterium]